VIITRAKEPSDEDSTTLNAEAVQFCEANVLVSLIDGVETRQQCESPWLHIHITSETHLKYLCDFHSTFMDFATALDEQEESIAGGCCMNIYYIIFGRWVIWSLSPYPHHWMLSSIWTETGDVA